MTTCLRSCDMKAIGDAANLWIAQLQASLIAFMSH